MQIDARAGPDGQNMQQASQMGRQGEHGPPTTTITMGRHPTRSIVTGRQSIQPHALSIISLFV